MGGSVKRECLTCGKVFFVFPYVVKDGQGKYCGKICADAGSRKGKIVKCAQCKKETWTRPSWLGSRKYCSQKCYREAQPVWNKGKTLTEENKKRISETCKRKGIRPPDVQSVRENRRRNMLIGRLTQLKKNPTKPEIKLAKKLDAMGLEHISQHPMYSKFIVDEWIPKLNLIIEVDGRYWHSKFAQMKKDQSKTAYLTKCGHKVVRIWDDELDEDIQKYLT